VAQDIVTGVDVPVIRALNLRSAHAAFTCTWWPDGLLMLDAAAPDGALPGGTGRRADEGVAAEVSRHRRIVLSGGLGPGNVAEAIGAVRPWGVDASSGLESAPGIKDPALIRRFVAAARSAAVAGGESR
jgi:phosphoribosylanthranilate isomerase